MKFTALPLSFLASCAYAQLEYTSTNNVTDLANLGSDLDFLDTLLGQRNTTGLQDALNLYQTSPLQSLSRDAVERPADSEFQKFVEYYGVPDYADQYVMAAFNRTMTNFANGNTDFTSMGYMGQEQIIKKAAAYMSVYIAAINSFEDAIAGCSADSPNDASILAWDEGVAMYYGGDGEAVAIMAERRCENFGTCVNGTSPTNIDLFDRFNAGKAALENNDCESARGIVEEITSTMRVPLVQGVLRAAYRLDEMNGGQKVEGYGTVFTAAVLPIVHACNAGDAEVIYNSMTVGVSTNTSYTDVRHAFERCYDCMGITCSDVAGLVDDDGAYYPGAEPCASTFMRYAATNDVTGSANLGADLDEMDELLGQLNQSGLEAAEALYLESPLRTLSSDAVERSPDSEFQKFVDYYGVPDYADQYVMAAFDRTITNFANGNVDFSSMGFEGQEQIIKKAAAYMSVYTAAINSFEDAVTGCSADSADAASILAWDQGVAMYYGTDGEAVALMAERRCGNFGTCVDGVDGMSSANNRLFDDFNAGEAALASGDCQGAAEAVARITNLMSIPLVQGALRGAYRAQPPNTGEKWIGFGTVFTSAVLPIVHACNADDAATISSNMETFGDFPAAKAAFENNYACMGITCSDVGGLLNDDGGYFENAEPCGDTAGAADGSSSATPMMEDLP